MPELFTITEEGKQALQRVWEGEGSLSPIESSLLTSAFKPTDWNDLAFTVRKFKPFAGYVELGRTTEALRNLEKRGYIEKV